VLLAAVAWPAGACSIPVFRYALERWDSERYPAVVFTRGVLPADAQPLLKSLQDSPANLGVALVDVDSPASTDALKLWQAQGSPALPWLAVRFPQGGKLAWSGALDAAGIAIVLDSPARKQLRQQLLGGTSAVWVLLECGDAARDDKIAALLEKQSADLAKRLLLSGTTDDTQLWSTLPLKLAFSVVRVSRTAPEETFFSALLQSELISPPDALDSAGPLVFPVYGRGRTLPALKEKELLSEKLIEPAQFLTGACACTAKELTPGLDLLIAADWEAEVLTGKYQRRFFGTFAGRSGDSAKLSSDVIGSYLTGASDKKPGQTYLVKVENDSKAVLEGLTRQNGKSAEVMGKLDDFAPDGAAKYLIVTSVVEVSATPPAKVRRKPGGL